MKSTEIMTSPKTGLTLVKLEKAGHIEWPVVYEWKPEAPEGTKWSSAKYFYSFEDAAEYYLKKLKEKDTEEK